jgi:predicted molibdopterin-dependent oxidoreductase YjgC
VDIECGRDAIEQHAARHFRFHVKARRLHAHIVVGAKRQRVLANNLDRFAQRKSGHDIASLVDSGPQVSLHIV